MVQSNDCVSDSPVLHEDNSKVDFSASADSLKKMSYEISGSIKVIFDTQTFDSGFSKREFVVTTEGKYPQDIKFECLQDKVELLNEFKQNQPVKVHFDIRGREYNDRYFVNLVAWRVEPLAGGASGGSDDQPPIPEDTTDYGIDSEPF